jgi:hypothetical protein
VSDSDRNPQRQEHDPDPPPHAPPREHVREMQTHLQEMEAYLRRMGERLRRLDEQLSHLEGVMNSGSYAVASRHGESKTVPKRRFRRRMGLRSPLSSAGPRRRSAQRNHELCEVFNGLRWIVRTGS